jgi:hypothetical protein
MVSIHVKDFDLLFGRIKGTSVEPEPFITYREGSVSFLKLYLMPFK